MAKKMISLEISDELREALRIEAFKRSISISAVIRQLLEEALKLPEKVNNSYEQN
jgi:plasmid stability protein